MRLGKSEQAAAQAGRIGVTIKEHNSAELSRVDILADPRTMWAKVRQLTGHRAETHAGNINHLPDGLGKVRVITYSKFLCTRVQL
jgi:hypothetical protein